METIGAQQDSLYKLNDRGRPHRTPSGPQAAAVQQGGPQLWGGGEPEDGCLQVD